MATVPCCTLGSRGTELMSIRVKVIFSFLTKSTCGCINLWLGTNPTHRCPNIGIKHECEKKAFDTHNIPTWSFYDRCLAGRPISSTVDATRVIFALNSVRSAPPLVPAAEETLQSNPCVLSGRRTHSQATL
ncbi:unnamed protein product [Pleuronectes platessa]|uniref:Uncharacterized protein n=1 Tax=Pleuronectes platessa TaxID=8262 RepID=A0A9N7Z560_PLEPL|nr:unnamed protein product [Pleuronectes platessa]